MDFPTNLSSPARVPPFEARFNPQDGQDLSLEILLDEVNGNSNTQHAAGGVCSSPLASIYPPSVPFTSFDQLRALFSGYFSAEVNAGRDFGLPNSDSPFNTSPQGSELSSCSSSSPPSSITSPISDELSLSFASPDLPFHELSTNDQDPAASLQACQYPLALSFSPNSQFYSTLPKQPFLQPVALPEELSTADVPIITDQSVGIDNTGAFSRSNSFLAVHFLETTALGLYYPSTSQSFHIPPLAIQADATILSTLPPPAPPAETRKVRAVVPTLKASRTKRVRSGKIPPPSHAVAAAFTGAVSGTDKFKCSVCGFPQSTLRKGDFLRHMRTHEDAKLTRYVCCGIHETHPAAAGLSPGHSVRLYNGCAFYGGCGKSYSRMDALQRHLGKSNCAHGSAEEHQIWRQLYL